ncbi:MAG: HDIG domain-containing protein, partial [Desulfobacterales bacterium]
VLVLSVAGAELEAPKKLGDLGRLKFRTSYGQNQYAHAIETAKLAGMIAEELGADAKIARAGGLLIGPVIAYKPDVRK